MHLGMWSKIKRLCNGTRSGVQGSYQEIRPQCVLVSQNWQAPYLLWAASQLVLVPHAQLRIQERHLNSYTGKINVVNRTYQYTIDKHDLIFLLTNLYTTRIHNGHKPGSMQRIFYYACKVITCMYLLAK